MDTHNPQHGGSPAQDDPQPSITRRTMLASAGGAAAAALGASAGLGAAPIDTAPAPKKGRIQQSICRWCHIDKVPLEDLAREAARMGYIGLDLVFDPKDWPVLKKHGLTSTMCSAGQTIGDGWNRKEKHDRFVDLTKKNIDLAVAAGYKKLITFSGNREGLSDEVGLANCAEGLKRVVGYAAEKDVTIYMELLNSRVDHHDYQCDRTPWGVELCKRVGSPRFKLLYDIYHMQIMEGDVIRTIRDNFEWLGHFHTGGNPGRNEIDETQELNYGAIMQALIDLKYDGYVAQEFIPKKDNLVSLAQAFRICDV